MPQHISRKELKSNQVQEALTHGAEAVLSHQTIMIYVVVAAVVVGLGVFGWRSYSERLSVKATAAFGEAMQTFEAPVLTTGQKPSPSEISYSQASNKFQDALKKFEDVASKYPRTHSGQLAHFYAALCLERLNQDAQAIPWLTGMESGSNPDFAAMARFELAQIYDRQGKSDQAIALYSQLLNSSSIFVPKPIVLLALAEHYRQVNPAQAAKYYMQVKSEFPDTGAAEEADHGLALLPADKS
ncbi:MAG TPA: tetratricopeptide repeat protein [Candidatus Acidoferrales bacterium]|nr:tetratricopeptide repeat protein [Candidatus Acidoferrales bacterium]